MGTLARTTHEGPPNPAAKTTARHLNCATPPPTANVARQAPVRPPGSLVFGGRTTWGRQANLGSMDCRDRRGCLGVSGSMVHLYTGTMCVKVVLAIVPVGRQAICGL